MTRPMLMIVLTLAIAGCAALSHVPPGRRPADFKLVVFVEAPADRNVQHVLEPDRVLHVAIGRDVTGRLYPPPTATLTPAQMDRLWELTRRFLVEPPRPTSDTDAIVVSITLTAEGRTHRWRSAPDEPGVGELVQELTALRGG